MTASTPLPAPAKVVHRQIARLELARRLLIGAAALSAVATIVALVIIGRIGDTYRIGLELTRDTAGVAAGATASAAEIADGASDLANSAAAGIVATRSLLDSSVDSVKGVSTALGTNVADSIAGGSSTANRVASWVNAIENFIPGNRPSLAEDLSAFADGLEPVPGQLRTLGGDLLTTADEIAATAKTLQPIADQLVISATQIDDAKAEIVEAGVLSTTIEQRAQDLLDSSSSTMMLARVLVLVIGLCVFAASIAAERSLLGVIHRGAGGGT